MWLVLCPSNDTSAIWAFQGLKNRGLEPIELVTAESLAFGVRWNHRLGTEGVTQEAKLADGRCICNTEVWGVLNRLIYTPIQGLALIHPSDREYVQQELSSFFLSWISALPDPVINQPTPWGLSGQWRHISEWITLAARAGLPVPYYRQSSRDFGEVMGQETRIVPVGTPIVTLIAIRDVILGVPVSPEIKAGCQRLAKLADTELLGIEFALGQEGDWMFTSATPHPDLQLGGEVLLDILAQVLRDGKETQR